jgi:hypothetical protein
MKSNKKTAIIVTILVITLIATLGISFLTGILRVPFEVVGISFIYNVIPEYSLIGLLFILVAIAIAITTIVVLKRSKSRL